MNQFDAVTVYWRLLTPELVQAVQGFGTKVLAWTVDYPQAADHLLQLGIDGITSNNMDLLVKLAGRSMPHPS